MTQPSTLDAAPSPSSFSASAPPVAATPAETLDASTTSALTGLADGTNALGFDVYNVARTAGHNLALSPLSLSTALTMTWLGARGVTATQMRAVLHTGATQEGTVGAEAAVLAWVRDPGRSATLKMASRLFGEKTYPFAPGYLQETDTGFGAPLQALDFKEAPEAARGAINDWIASQTGQHITGLLPPHSVTPETRLVLTNAIYFAGLWEHPFRPAETHPEAFHDSATHAGDVPTMHALETLAFAQTDGVKVLDLPYEGGQLGMTFVLPDAVDGLDAVEARFNPTTFSRWVIAQTPTRVRVALPRFEIAPKEPLALGPILAGLGMPAAFDRHEADFTGMGVSPDPENRLFLGGVFHKAYVKVDESGTVAAAATGGSMMHPTFVLREPPPQAFVADHPFLFVLRDFASGTILFMGRVAAPAGR